VAKKKTTENATDHGLFPGLVVVSVVLLLWGGTNLSFSAPDTPQPVRAKTELAPASSVVPRQLDDLIPTPATPQPSDESYLDDPRWLKAGKDGDAAWASYQADLKESEEEGGINMLASRADLKQALEESVSLLEGMKSDYQHDATALEQINRRQKRYQEKLGFTIGK